MLIGTPGPDQTYTDLNEDFSYYQIYECVDDRTLLSINIRDSDFFGNCPEHGTKLRRLDGTPDECPKCGGKLTCTRLEMHPLEESERK